MRENIKFYALVAAGVLAVVVPSVLLLGGYGLLLDCAIFGGLAALSE